MKTQNRILFGIVILFFAAMILIGCTVEDADADAPYVVMTIANNGMPCAYLEGKTGSGLTCDWDWRSR